MASEGTFDNAVLAAVDHVPVVPVATGQGVAEVLVRVGPTIEPVRAGMARDEVGPGVAGACGAGQQKQLLHVGRQHVVGRGPYHVHPVVEGGLEDGVATAPHVILVRPLTPGQRGLPALVAQNIVLDATDQRVADSAAAPDVARKKPAAFDPFVACRGTRGRFGRWCRSACHVGPCVG